MIKKILIFIIVLAFVPSSIKAQKLSTQEVKDFTEECHDLVAYLEFTLNSIGDNELNPKEKDIIISESYAKLFRDSKVQVEDDLVPDREAVTNKDVQAYLKDVDFFFNQVIFSYKILSVKLQQNESNEAYFKIKALRTLSGTTLKKDSIHNKQTRFIEVAINANQRDLKIVSIYTTKINENEENIHWWNMLPIGWKEILGQNANLCQDITFSQVLNIQKDFIIIEKNKDTAAIFSSISDTCKHLDLSFEELGFDTLYLSNDSLKEVYNIQIENALIKIMSIKELDLSKRYDILQLEALTKLTSLHSLNVSQTMVNDLYPIRNLIDLQDLNISNTQVNQLDALVYSMSLQKLDISNTKVYSLDPLSNLSKLRILDISNTHIDDIHPLANLTDLTDLKMNNSMVDDLDALEHLKSITSLKIDGTSIADIHPLSKLNDLKILSCNKTNINDLQSLKDLNNLSVIYCDNTQISSIQALDGMPKLSRIYCDNTFLSKEDALAFMNDNPNVLVVYESRELQKWYTELNNNWKHIFQSYVDIDQSNPTKEQLHQLASIPEIDIHGHKEIQSLEALSRILNLKKLDASHTSIQSIEALYELRELNSLNIRNTQVSSLSPIENNNQLKYLNISQTKIEELDALRQLHSLSKLYMDADSINDISPLLTLNSIRLIRADNTLIDASQFEEFMLAKPKCLVIYQSTFLKEWWNQLSPQWVSTFKSIQKWSQEPKDKELHQLVKRTKLSISNNRDINDISPLAPFIFLKKLQINGTQTSDFSVLKEFKRLEILDLSQNPVSNLEVLQNKENIKSINISNTPMNNLDWVSSLSNLKFLDISGTQIKNLKPLSNIESLETLIAFNTRISNLKPLNQLSNLRVLKVYNTRISAKKIKTFSNLNPSCTVDFF